MAKKKAVKKSVKNVTRVEVSNSHTTSPIVWVLLLVAIVMGGWVWYQNKMTTGAELSINEVSDTVEDEISLARWDFEVSADMGKATGWYAKKPYTGSIKNISPVPRASWNVAQLDILATTLSNGMMVVPGSIEKDVSLINEKVNLDLTSINRSVKVRVEGTATWSNRTINGVPAGTTLPESKSRIIVNNYLKTIPGTMVEVKPVRSNGEYTIEFTLSAATIADMKRLRQTKINKLEIWPNYNNLGVISNFKVDSIVIE